MQRPPRATIAATAIVAALTTLAASAVVRRRNPKQQIKAALTPDPPVPLSRVAVDSTSPKMEDDLGDEIELLLADYQKNRNAANRRTFGLVVFGVFLAIYLWGSLVLLRNYFDGKVGNSIDLSAVEFELSIDVNSAVAAVLGLLALVAVLTVAIATIDYPSDDPLRDPVAARRSIWISQVSFVCLFAGSVAMTVAISSLTSANVTQKGVAVLLIVLALGALVISATVVDWAWKSRAAKMQSISSARKLSTWLETNAATASEWSRWRLVRTLLAICTAFIVLAQVVVVAGVLAISRVDGSQLKASWLVIFPLLGCSLYFLSLNFVAVSQLVDSWKYDVDQDTVGKWTSKALSGLIVVISLLAALIALTAFPTRLAYVSVLLGGNWIIIVLIPYLLVQVNRPFNSRRPLFGPIAKLVRGMTGYLVWKRVASRRDFLVKRQTMP